MKTDRIIKAAVVSLDMAWSQLDMVLDYMSELKKEKPEELDPYFKALDYIGNTILETRETLKTL